MVIRDFWKNLIVDAWKKRSIVWLSGVRRVGKTTLCQELSDAKYFDCELPRVRQMLEDPEAFLESNRKQKIVLDEVHRLKNPSELLKIAADHYPDIKVIATGSSSLGASSKFKDTLAGRKLDLWLTPLLLNESSLFGFKDIRHRLLFGGLPPFFMLTKFPEKEFQEWIDAYWSKDIQELFRLEKRYSFQRFVELLLIQSGNIFEANRFSAPCEASRNTIINYLSVLEATYVAHIIRPFSSRKSNEIIATPKVYGFDTAFVCLFKGWFSLRQDDYGILWEHIVLNEIQGRLQTRKINYWRDKQGHEVDFVFIKKRMPIALECKWSAKKFDVTNLEIFRKKYPNGENYVVAFDIDQSFIRSFGNLKVQYVNLNSLITQLEK